MGQCLSRKQRRVRSRRKTPSAAVDGTTSNNEINTNSAISAAGISRSPQGHSSRPTHHQSALGGGGISPRLANSDGLQPSERVAEPSTMAGNDDSVPAAMATQPHSHHIFPRMGGGGTDKNVSCGGNGSASTIVSQGNAQAHAALSSTVVAPIGPEQINMTGGAQVRVGAPTDSNNHHNHQRHHRHGLSTARDERAAADEMVAAAMSVRPHPSLGGHAVSGDGRVLVNDGLGMMTASEKVAAIVKKDTTRIIDNLVQETLLIIRTLVDSNSAPPEAMLHLHRIADHENGWLAIAFSMIRNITTADPLGPAVITLILDECPLPAKDTVMHLSRELAVSKEKARSPVALGEPIVQRNVCILYGCLAEKLAGPTSVALLNEAVLDYLIENLSPDKQPAVVLHALIALEKFALVSENKATILRRLSSLSDPPFDALEKWCFEEEDLVKREVGFCAQWNQDNLFVRPERRFTYECVDNSHVNAMLNTNDTSEYLKLSADGLEARSDVLSFESVRCTFPVVKGAWYYEVTVVTCGIMQIGWASKNSKFLNHDGYGIGDDEYSIAYDGCRQLIWYRANCSTHAHRCWKPGDVLGCFLDIENRVITFTLNGDPVRLPSAEQSLFDNVAGTNLFAAASFMSFQQCIFNFGGKPFRYAPSCSFSTFNDKGELTAQSSTVYPRHKRLEMLRMISFQEDSCSLCYDEKSDTRLLPCGHSGFCKTCARQIEVCPLCRQVIHRTEVCHPTTSTTGASDTAPLV